MLQLLHLDRPRLRWLCLASSRRRADDDEAVGHAVFERADGQAELGGHLGQRRFAWLANDGAGLCLLDQCAQPRRLGVLVNGHVAAAGRHHPPHGADLRQALGQHDHHPATAAPRIGTAQRPRNLGHVVPHLTVQHLVPHSVLPLSLGKHQRQRIGCSSGVLLQQVQDGELVGERRLWAVVGLGRWFCVGWIRHCAVSAWVLAAQ